MQEELDVLRGDFIGMYNILTGKENTRSFTFL